MTNKAVVNRAQCAVQVRSTLVCRTLEDFLRVIVVPVSASSTFCSCHAYIVYLDKKPRNPRSCLFLYWRAPPNSLGKVETARLCSSSYSLVGEEKRGRSPLFPRLAHFLGASPGLFPLSPCHFRFPPQPRCCYG